MANPGVAFADLTDEQLYSAFARSLQAGESGEPHFRELYNRYAGPLFRYIYRFAGSPESTEEVLQEVFLQLVDGKFDGVNLKAWLYVVSRNRALKLLAKNSKETTESSCDDTSSGITAESRLIDGQGERLWARAQEKIPGDLQSTWQLRRQGLDYREISARLGIPLGTVKSRFHRLVVFLKKELGNEV